MHKARLVLLRHGKSDWRTGEREDVDRPLARRGRSDARRMGRWLKEENIIPEIILCSPALRARQTVVAVNKALAVDDDHIMYEDDLYGASCDPLLGRIGEYQRRYHHIMITGHNPGLDELLCVLCRTPPPVRRDGKLMTTAAVAVLTFDNTEVMCEPATGELLCLMRPKALPDVI